MANRFTAVPPRPVPDLGRRMAPVVAVADLFMWLMISRPNGLSLRDSWVTPATLWLAAVYSPAALILAALLVGHGGWPSFLAAAALFVTAWGSTAVVLLGVVQRRAAAPS
jgi:hypothetical protein